jgi:hypothetical protein
MLRLLSRLMSLLLLPRLPTERLCDCREPLLDLLREPDCERLPDCDCRELDDERRLLPEDDLPAMGISCLGVGAARAIRAAVRT